MAAIPVNPSRFTDQFGDVAVSKNLQVRPDDRRKLYSTSRYVVMVRRPVGTDMLLWQANDRPQSLVLPPCCPRVPLAGFHSLQVAGLTAAQRSCVPSLPPPSLCV